MFHVNCLAENHFIDIYNHDSLNNEYFNKLTCQECYSIIPKDDLMHLHRKYLKDTQHLLDNHKVSIEQLEAKVKQLQFELRVCYDYKHKLDKCCEKSKEIVSILSTML